ncbi:Ff.00g133460.m01.CDS01 [Fusarium sp. VM40]|nr:Ff.00g133460.m01.CDS01 [Fusarium sp. VM40]
MALNDAIQAVLVYHNIDRAKDRKAELWAYNTVKTKLVLRDVVPSVPLATFIVYWPHYKRFHEVQKMSRYMHPFRFAHSNYALDCKVFGSRAEIDSSHIDSKRVFELVDNLKSLEPDIPANHFIPVLPHSMPGSKLIWPKGTGAAQKETTALAGLLLLNDINLLMQLIAMPACFANTIVRSLVSDYIYAPSIPTQNFWKPDVKPDLVSISGEEILVGPFFQNISPSTTRQDLDHSHDPGRFNRRIVQRSRMYLNIAKALKIPIEKIIVDPKSGLITWDGMPSEAVIAAEQGMPSVVKRAVGMPQDLNKIVAAPAPTQAFNNS